jgi:hypothetical protein
MPAQNAEDDLNHQVRYGPSHFVLFLSYAGRVAEEKGEAAAPSLIIEFSSML